MLHYDPKIYIRKIIKWLDVHELTLAQVDVAQGT